MPLYDTWLKSSRLNQNMQAIWPIFFVFSASIEIIKGKLCQEILEISDNVFWSYVPEQFWYLRNIDILFLDVAPAIVGRFLQTTHQTVHICMKIRKKNWKKKFGEKKNRDKKISTCFFWFWPYRLRPWFDFRFYFFNLKLGQVLW